MAHIVLAHIEEACSEPTSCAIVTAARWLRRCADEANGEHLIVEIDVHDVLAPHAVMACIAMALYSYGNIQLWPI